MKILIAILAVICLVILGCQNAGVWEKQEIERDSMDLQGAFVQKLQEQRLFTDKLLGGCPPEPLPEVEFRIGQVMSGLGEVRVPVYMSDQYPSNGMLLSVKYDSKNMKPLRIEAGEAWAQADFVHFLGNPVKGLDLWIWLILGWEIVEDGNMRFAVPLPVERLQEPMAYMVFEVVKPGKGHIVWDPVPDPAPVFYRRAEALVTVGECDWDVVDWYKSSPNSTGKVTVVPGHVIGTGN